MNDPMSAPLKPNPKTQAAHRAQMVRQVWLPLGLSIVIILALAVLVILGGVSGSDNISRLSSLSLIYAIILPSAAFGLVALILLILMIYLLTRANRGLPLTASRVQNAVNQAAAVLRKAADAVVQPIINVQSFNAKIRAIGKHKVS
ncbi:MAG: hypothetical protein ABFD44_07670 [Anaerolineaceae bacterium]